MWVKRLDVLMFEVLYLSQPYQLNRQDLQDLKYFIYFIRHILFVVYISSDPISLCERSQISNLGFVSGKVFTNKQRFNIDLFAEGGVLDRSQLFQ